MTAPLTVIDVMTAALGAATVVLAAVAIGIGMLAFWGYRDLRGSAVRRAEAEARRIAADVAAREVRALLDKQGSEGDISAAYQDKPQ